MIGKKFGAYEILEKIGTGGMAVVYKARHAAMGRDVAIKIMAEGMVQKRFIREVQTIARLEHPHILPVYDFGEVDGVAYLVMRYLSTGTLADFIRDEGAKPLEQVVALIIQAADALHYAHQHGVVHRDVKPSNLLMDKFGKVYLTDFGIAKVFESTHQITRTGTTMGTPAYMSPEQVQAEVVDARSDIYSLGIIVYQMLVGRVPFEADTPIAIALKHINELPPVPSHINPDIPYAVEQVVLKAIAKDRAARFQSCEEFVRALESVVKTKPSMPAQDVPAQDAPTQDVPAQDVPVQDAPAQAVPAQDVPVQDAPAQDVPVSHVEELPETSDAMSAAPILAAVQEGVGESALVSTLKKKRSLNPLLWGGLGIVLLSSLVIAYLSGSGRLAAWLATSTPTPTISSTSMNSLSSTSSPTEVAIPTPTAATSTTPLPTQRSGENGHLMALVPAGEFEMGRKTGGSTGYDDPVHTVYLDAYYIDLYEVTNTQYAVFLNQNGNQIEGSAPWLDVVSSNGRVQQSGDIWAVIERYANHPVTWVSWYGAVAYCEWIGGNLPTEAQWEKAARGTDERTFPWGEDIDSSLANYGSHVGDTMPVGSYPDGISPYGLYDMAGNVPEWVLDWISGSYYKSTAAHDNPTGPENNISGRVVRGGSWYGADDLRSGSRRNGDPSYSVPWGGFRCASSP